MATAVERFRTLRLERLEATAWTTPVLLTTLAGVSLFLRTRILNAGFWIDEGISVGIAHHGLWSIPHLLRQDGSPPLYYMLLHVWIGWFGDGERATHALSLVCSLACIPFAYAVAKALFGRVTGWITGALVAFDPYLTYYAQETRMYELMALLSFVVALAYVHGVLHGRRRWLPVLAVAVAAELYTHNWGLFVCVALAVATVLLARDRWREAALAAVGVAILYAPWLPTLAFQAKHTGAPWASAPGFRTLLLAPGTVLAGDAPLMAVVLVGGSGLVAVRRRGAREWRVAEAFAVIVAVTVVVAWVSSQLSPAWATRYFAVILGPLLLVAALGLARAGRLGLVALVLVVGYWFTDAQKDDKSNVRMITQRVAPYVHRGDLVLSTHPEQIPVLRYYLGPGLRWATQLGPVRDPRIFDWRDAVHRIDAATPQRDLEPLLANVPRGGRLILVYPVFRDYRAWKAPWTKRVYRTSLIWTRRIERDPRFREVRHVQTNEILLKRNFFKPLQATVYVRAR